MNTPQRLRLLLVLLVGASAVTVAVVGYLSWWRGRLVGVIREVNADRVTELDRLVAPLDYVFCHPDGRRIASFRFNEPIRLYQLRGLRALETSFGRQCYHVAFDASGRYLAFSESDSKRNQVHLATVGGQLLHSFVVKESQPGVVFSPDGKTLVTGGYGSYVRLFRVADAKFLQKIQIPGAIGALTPRFSPDGKWLAVGNRNGVTRIFHAQTGKPARSLDRRMTQGLNFSPDGATLAICYVDGKVGLWTVATGKLEALLDSQGEEAYVVAWSLDGTVLATGGHKTPLLLWDVSKREVIKALDRPQNIMGLEFSPNGKRLLSTLADPVTDGPSRDASGFPNLARRLVVWGIPE